MEDQQIIKLYWDRDEAALSATEQSYGAYCFQIASRILQDPEDAKECVNDTWLKAWNSIPPQKPQRLAAFLGKIARNLALDRYRRQNAQKRAAGQTALALEELEECIPACGGVEQHLDELALTKAIGDFLAHYPQKEQRIFVGRYWHLYSVSQLAEAYGIGKSRAASLLHRMRKKLKLHLEKEELL